jgi:hypothetical protein
MALCYENDPLWPVEMYDQVEVRVDGATFDGEVRKIHGDGVTVRYGDYLDTCRTTTNPRVKTMRFPIQAVDLIRRDG